MISFRGGFDRIGSVVVEICFPVTFEKATGDTKRPAGFAKVTGDMNFMVFTRIGLKLSGDASYV